MTQIIIESGEAANVKELLRSAVENELRIIKGGINRTEKELSRFEGVFGMKSSRFYEQYLKGVAGDRPEHIRWAGEYETLERLGRDYNELRKSVG
ncbi:hypothetical protein QUF72_17765 [Desulfobacterales bacterium HSG2]|nr:hypothetical protein [Desulfobacterales bacterium HSG2]